MIGILGGMGPYATMAFYKKILYLTRAQKDSEHIHMWIDSNTTIPSRNRHFIYGETSPVQGMIDSIENMKKIGIKSIYIPCNSASYFIPEIRKKVQDINIIGTIDITINHIVQHVTPRRVMVIGAYIVYTKEPYKEALEKNNFTYVKHNEIIQRKVEDLIYKIKTDHIDHLLVEEAKALYQVIMKKYKIDMLVLGCTELCIVFDHVNDIEVEVIDTNHQLAIYLVEKEK